jgi:serine/threonine protein kinase
LNTIAQTIESKVSGLAAELNPGDALGPFRLERLLGEGGMAHVYLATRDSDGAVVALKLMKPKLAANETYRRRFAHEVRAAADVRHENLVPILDSGELEGRPYIAAAFVDGQTLEERVRERGPLELAGVRRLASEIGAALDALHRAGIVHRDVKASNILLTADATAMLTDFGLVRGERYTKLTRPGQVVGTLEYLAPELIMGEQATVASDVYALGCTVYEALTGKTPFAGKGVFQIGTAHLEEEPPDPTSIRPDCGPALARAVCLALAKDPGHRPLTAVAGARAVGAAADADGV